MSLQIINGIHTAGIEVAKNFDVAYDFLAVLKSGNTVEDQMQNEINQVLMPFVVDVERIDGQPLPVKEHNIRFTKGGVQTTAKEFLPYWSTFNLEKSQGRNVEIANFTDETLFEYKNLGIDPMEKVMEDMEGVYGVYNNAYLPNVMLKSLICGTTITDALPAIDNGTGQYTTSFGFARGESYDSYLHAKTTTKTMNLYRVIKTSTIAGTDIRTTAKMLRETKLFGKGGGQKGIMAIGAPDTIQNLASMANSPENKDLGIFGDVTYMYGVNFKKVEGMHDGFLIFLDMSYMNRLIVRGVNKDPEQRGLTFIPKNDIQTFSTFKDFVGGKARIWEEEYYMPYRLSGAILGVDPTFADAGQIIKAGSPAELALEAWITALTEEYEG